MKTAIEWLEDQLFELRNPTLNQIEILNQAKEIEKQQIIEAHGNKLIQPKTMDCEYWRSGEDYYNKIFNKEE